MIFVPETCPCCRSAYAGGAAAPGEILVSGRRVFYDCGAALSISTVVDIVAIHTTLITGCGNDKAAAAVQGKQSWPRDSALEHGVAVGEIACPKCGAVATGALEADCVVCDHPYFPKD